MNCQHTKKICTLHGTRIKVVQFQQLRAPLLNETPATGIREESKIPSGVQAPQGASAVCIDFAESVFGMESLYEPSRYRHNVWYMYLARKGQSSKSSD
jgi:hypothetical protein